MGLARGEFSGEEQIRVIRVYSGDCSSRFRGRLREEYASHFRVRGGRVVFVELEAIQEERLRRNESAFRLAEKPFTRDLAASRRQLPELDGKYQLNSNGVFDDRPDYLRLDNTALSPGEVAERVIARFGLALRAHEG